MTGNLAAKCLGWVKTGKALGEHMFSALPPKADSSRTSRHVRIVPQADIEPSRAEAKKLQPTSMSTVRFEPIVADLTSTLGLAECVLKNDFVTSEGKKVASSRRDRLSARISRHKVPLE